MGLDSVPAPTSLLHLFTLQSTGDSLKRQRKHMTCHYDALFIPAGAEGGLGYRNGKYPEGEKSKGVSLLMVEAIPGLSHGCHKVIYEPRWRGSLIKKTVRGKRVGSTKKSNFQRQE